MDFCEKNGWSIHTFGIEIEVENFFLDRGYFKGTPAFKNRVDAIIRMLRVEAYTREKRRFVLPKTLRYSHGKRSRDRRRHR